MLRTIAFVLALGVGPALAGEIDFSVVVKDLNGPAYDCNKVDKDGKCVEIVPMTLGRLCGQALSMNQQAQPRGPMATPQRSLAEMAKRGRLAEKVFADAKVALTAPEVSMIEDDLPNLPGVRSSIIYHALQLIDPEYVRRLDDAK